MDDALATVTAVVTLVTVVIALVVSLRSNSRSKQIHVLVNSRMTEVQERVKQLSETLRDAGIDVPPSPREEEERRP